MPLDMTGMLPENPIAIVRSLSIKKGWEIESLRPDTASIYLNLKKASLRFVFTFEWDSLSNTLFVYCVNPACAVTKEDKSRAQLLADKINNATKDFEYGELCLYPIGHVECLVIGGETLITEDDVVSEEDFYELITETLIYAQKILPFMEEVIKDEKSVGEAFMLYLES